MKLLLHLLLTELGLDMATIWYNAFLFPTMLRMIAAKSDELFANRTAIVTFPFATLRMFHDSFHFHTAGYSAILHPTVGGMDE